MEPVHPGSLNCLVASPIIVPADFLEEESSPDRIGHWKVLNYRALPSRDQPPLPAPEPDCQNLLVVRGIETLSEHEEALANLRAAVQAWLTNARSAVLILLACSRSLVQNLRGSALVDDARRLRAPCCTLDELCDHESTSLCDCAGFLTHADGQWGLAQRWKEALGGAVSGNEKFRLAASATAATYREALAMLPPRIVSELHYYAVNQGQTKVTPSEMDSGTPGALVEVGVSKIVDDGEVDLNPWFGNLGDLQSCVIAHMRNLTVTTQQDREIWDGLFSLERQLRLLVAGHLGREGIALPESLIEIARRRLDGPGSPLDPLDYISLDKLLETARDLGVRPPLGDMRFWDRAIIELVPVRNRSAHYRYSHPGDLQRVRQYSRLLGALDAK